MKVAIHPSAEFVFELEDHEQFETTKRYTTTIRYRVDRVIAKVDRENVSYVIQGRRLIKSGGSGGYVSERCWGRLTDGVPETLWSAITAVVDGWRSGLPEDGAT